MTSITDAKQVYSCHLEFAETCQVSKAAQDLLDEIIGSEELEVTISPGDHRFTVNGFSHFVPHEESRRHKEGLNG